MPQLRSVEARIKRAIRHFNYQESKWRYQEQFGVIQWFGPDEQVLTENDYKARATKAWDHLVAKIIGIAKEKK